MYEYVNKYPRGVDAKQRRPPEARPLDHQGNHNHKEANFMYKICTSSYVKILLRPSTSARETAQTNLSATGSPTGVDKPGHDDRVQPPRDRLLLQPTA